VAVLPALADIDALEAWTGDTIPDDDPRALAVLAAASALVRSETRRTWLDDMGALAAVPDELGMVVVQVAARKWLNPEDVIQDGTGPFTARFSERTADGLYLTDTERAICARHRLQSTGVPMMRCRVLPVVLFGVLLVAGPVVPGVSGGSGVPVLHGPDLRFGECAGSAAGEGCGRRVRPHLGLPFRRFVLCGCVGSRHRCRVARGDGAEGWWPCESDLPPVRWPSVDDLADRPRPGGCDPP
jgi:hypothetical protein